MKIQVKTPQLSLSKDLLRFRPSEPKFTLFKTKLAEFQQRIDNNEREDQQKTYVQNFLRDAFYAGTNDVNIKGTIDLAIFLGPTSASRVGVIVEAKAPGNKGQMVSAEKPNVKALHELVLYFMRERVDEGNDDLKYLVATNINEWFIFAATDFNKLFYENTKFRKTYEDWRDKLKVSSNTDHFYDQIVKPFIDELDATLECTHFDLRTYDIKTAERRLIALYKILSPHFLLKKPFADDSNTLDKKFYTELLHIIGLEEYKDKNKTLIRRKLVRGDGSLLEKAIAKLESEYFVFDHLIWKKYGEKKHDQIYNAALELCIVWINRILFLKLLESQLLGYHDSATLYRFLNTDKVNNFNELSRLFHDVLNCPVAERNAAVAARYPSVPYLNSSLFDYAEVEMDTIRVHALDDNGDLSLPVHSILKKIGEKATSLPTLQYLFRFLDAYDFASEGKEEIQKENRSLINASVLGKVFEKINGYKDGSIYTPGFITMYMCRQAIRLAVVQKFKDETEFDGADFDELSNWIKGRNYQKENIKAFNAVIDSLKICDPAVGSGHFLVSALNEFLSIKSELGIFADGEFKTFGDYKIDIANDELIITDRENNLFEYKIREGRPLNDEMQRLQSTLFHEKQKLIENCLFGVDINPNSVKICRLRLWIELLKNAYYKDTDLETLPNIDINIKEGNSLISRFALDEDLADVLKQVKFSIDDYRALVHGYKETRDRETKRDFERRIKAIKDEFKTQLFHYSPERLKLKDLRDQVTAAEQKTFLFGEEDEKKEKRLTKIEKLKADIEKQAAIVRSLEENVIFEKAFEWRFEFPEVLGNNGDFLGFDLIIGNPPYVNAIELKKNLAEPVYKFLKSNYQTAKGAVDLFVYFFEQGVRLLKADLPLAFITPNRYLSASYADALRAFLFSETQIDSVIDYSHVRVFAEASTYPLVTVLVKNDADEKSYDLAIGKYDETKDRIHFKNENSEKLNLLESYIWGYLLNEKLPLTEKVMGRSVSILESAQINATSTASEADDYHTLINETGGFKLVNTGTIDRYESLWGQSRLVDKGKRFLKPFLPRNSKKISDNRQNLYGSKKIILAKIALATEAFYDEYGEYASINTNCFHSFNVGYDPKFLLAWLNSRLFQYTFECFFEGLKMQGGYLSYSAPYLSKMFVPKIRGGKQKPFVVLVDQILELKKSGAATTALENQIDKMVYELYSLTPEEIRLVEGN